MKKAVVAILLVALLGIGACSGYSCWGWGCGVDCCTTVCGGWWCTDSCGAYCDTYYESLEAQQGAVEHDSAVEVW